MAPTESPSKFETTLNETTFAQFDWNTLSPTSTTAPSDGLKAVIDGLAARINAHAAAPDFASHSALYDVLNDPAESNNIAGQQPEALARLKQRLIEEVEAKEPTALRDMNASDRTSEQLRALGYLE